MVRQQYLAIQDRGTIPHNDVPFLHLADGQRMKSQSYVHLDHFFEIESQYLESFYDGSRCLTRDSVDIVQFQLGRFITGDIPRLHGNRPGRPVSPLEFRNYTAHDLGLPHCPSSSRRSSPSHAPTFLPPAPGNHALAITPPCSPDHSRISSWRAGRTSTPPPSSFEREPRRDSILSWRSPSFSPRRGLVQNASDSVALPSPQTSPERATPRGDIAGPSQRGRSPQRKDMTGNWRVNARPVQ